MSQSTNQKLMRNENEETKRRILEWWREIFCFAFMRFRLFHGLYRLTLRPGRYSRYSKVVAIGYDGDEDFLIMADSDVSCSAVD